MSEGKTVKAIRVGLTKRERIKLLLKTYPYVSDAKRSGEDVRSGKPTSGTLHRGGVWDEGSFTELERWLDDMKRRSPSVSWHVWEFYVLNNPNGKARRRKADLGLDFLVKRMPHNVYVPREVSENAGFLSESKAASRPFLRVA